MASRLRRGAPLIRRLSAWMGSGSAVHHYMLRRVRDTDQGRLPFRISNSL